MPITPAAVGGAATAPHPGEGEQPGGVGVTATLEQTTVPAAARERVPHSAIVPHCVGKTFGAKRVLDDVSIEIAAGTVYALLGPVFVQTASVLVRRSSR